MSNEMEVLVKSGFALVQSPVKRGNDGKKTLKGAHAVLNGENLSGAAINAGTVEWFPKSPLKFRSASYHAIDRLIQSYGVAWGAGTLVPLDKLDQLLAEFEIEKQKFFMNVDLLMPNYDLLIEAHKSQQPDPVKKVIDAVRLDWQSFRASFSIFLPTPSKFMPLTDDLNGTAKEIIDAAMQEICEEAAAIKDKILGKQQVDPKSIKPIKRLADKCKDFSILHPALESFSDQFDALASTLVAPIVGDKQVALVAYLSVLSDPNAVETWMNNNQVEMNDSALNSMFGFNNPSVASPSVLPVFTPAPAQQANANAVVDWESFGI